MSSKSKSKSESEIEIEIEELLNIIREINPSLYHFVTEADENSRCKNLLKIYKLIPEIIDPDLNPKMSDFEVGERVLIRFLTPVPVLERTRIRGNLRPTGETFEELEGRVESINTEDDISRRFLVEEPNTITVSFEQFLGDRDFTRVDSPIEYGFYYNNDGTISEHFKMYIRFMANPNTTITGEIVRTVIPMRTQTKLSFIQLARDVREEEKNSRAHTIPQRDLLSYPFLTEAIGSYIARGMKKRSKKRGTKRKANKKRRRRVRTKKH